jgi:hypothetical protein
MSLDTNGTIAEKRNSFVINQWKKVKMVRK